MQNYKIQHPNGPADTDSVGYAASIALPTIDDMETYITVAQLTGPATMTISPHGELKTGAKVYLKLAADGTNRTVTFSTGFTAAAITVTADKTILATFFYNGTSFEHAGTGTLN